MKLILELRGEIISLSKKKKRRRRKPKQPSFENYFLGYLSRWKAVWFQSLEFDDFVFFYISNQC